jgi:hypothetical protein
MSETELWCRVTVVEADGSEVARFELEGPGSPELSALDHVARMALLARRHGGEIIISDIAEPLCRLFELAGLTLQVKGQPEEGEEALGVHHGQEELHPGNTS